MGDLNSDWVLWASIGAVIFSIVALAGFAYKATRGIEGLEQGKDTVPPLDDK